MGMVRVLNMQICDNHSLHATVRTSEMQTAFIFKDLINKGGKNVTK